MAEELMSMCKNCNMLISRGNPDPVYCLGCGAIFGYNHDVTITKETR